MSESINKKYFLEEEYAKEWDTSKYLELMDAYDTFHNSLQKCIQARKCNDKL